MSKSEKKDKTKKDTIERRLLYLFDGVSDLSEKAKKYFTDASNDAKETSKGANEAVDKNFEKVLAKAISPPSTPQTAAAIAGPKPQTDEMHQLSKDLGQEPEYTTTRPGSETGIKPESETATKPKSKEKTGGVTNEVILSWYDKKKQDIEREYEGEKNSLERREMLTALAEAMTRFGAALAGQKSGVDLSALNIAKTDFEKKYDRISKHREGALARAGTQNSELNKLKQLREDNKKRDDERKEDIALKKEFHGDLLKNRDDVNFKAQRQHDRLVSNRAEPTGQQTNDMKATATAIDLLSLIMKKKADINTGPYSSKINAFAKKLGIADPDKSSFRADLVDNLAAKIKILSGAQSSDREFDRLNITVPNMEMDDDEFESVANSALEKLERYKEIQFQMLEAAGKNVDKARAVGSKAKPQDLSKAELQDLVRAKRKKEGV